MVVIWCVGWLQVISSERGCFRGAMGAAIECWVVWIPQAECLRWLWMLVTVGQAAVTWKLNFPPLPPPRQAWASHAPPSPPFPR